LNRSLTWKAAERRRKTNARSAPCGARALPGPVILGQFLRPISPKTRIHGETLAEKRAHNPCKMPSFIWRRNPKEAFDNPYEYDAQKQFDREATQLLKTLYDHLAHPRERRYYIDERTPEKAIWLLHLDALGSIADAHDNLQRGRHRAVPHLSRSSQETLNVAAVFSTRTTASAALLEEWFNGAVMTPKKYVKLVPHATPDGPVRHKHRYDNLSGYTHRTYHAIKEGYCLASDGHIFHDQSGMSFQYPPQAGGASALPHTISVYYTLIASDIWFLADEFVARGSLAQEQLDQAFKESLEEGTVPRRFFPAGNHPEARAQIKEQMRRGIPVVCTSPPTKIEPEKP
jgi:hypothetical protein